MKRLLCLLLLMLVVGTVSADTLIVYPNIDGSIYRYATLSNFTSIRRGVGTGNYSTLGRCTIWSSATTNEFTDMVRYGMTYNLTSVSSTNTITGVTLSLYGSIKTNTFSSTINMVVSNASPASNTAWADSDFQKFGQTLLGNYTYNGWTVGAWNNATLSNSYFQSKLGGYAPIMYRSSADYDNSSPTWGNTKSFYGSSERLSNTTYKPFITITYTPPDTTPPASITGLTNSTATCEQITWTWTNPTDVDFNGTQYSLTGFGGTTNLTNSSTFLLAGGLTGGTPYTFSTRTFDINGNLNATYVNDTATPSSCAGAPVASFTTNKNFLRIPNPISVTDTSTPTPTSWQWSWGDGTANSTTQNATHTYTKRGKFNIILSVADFNGGSNTSAPVSVKVVGYENYY